MRIVTKAELLTMPKGTPFAEYRGANAAWPEGFEIFSREGYYDNTMRYLVWEPDDVHRIIALLQGADTDPGDQ